MARCRAARRRSHHRAHLPTRPLSLKFDVLQGTIWAISLARTYKWQSDSAAAQADFTVALVKLYRAISNGGASLRVIGVTEGS
jgi:hypothetical protein